MQCVPNKTDMLAQIICRNGLDIDAVNGDTTCGGLIKVLQQRNGGRLPEPDPLKIGQAMLAKAYKQPTPDTIQRYETHSTNGTV